MRCKKWVNRPQRNFPMHLKRHVRVLSGKERRATGKRSGHLDQFQNTQLEALMHSNPIIISRILENCLHHGSMDFHVPSVSTPNKTTICMNLSYVQAFQGLRLLRKFRRYNIQQLQPLARSIFERKGTVS